MNKEFIPYAEALALKELGFDKLCFAIYNTKQDLLYVKPRKLFGDIKAPLYQQTFRWFREKYNLESTISIDVWFSKKATWRICGGIQYKICPDTSHNQLYDWDSKEKYNTYEKAELECLKKLIEMVKNG